MRRNERSGRADRAAQVQAAAPGAESPLPDLPQLPGLDIREPDDLVSHERLVELRTNLARDARSRREAEATSATLRMG
jgi:hypothetical protein